MSEHTPAIDFENLPAPSEGFLVTQGARPSLASGDEGEKPGVHISARMGFAE